MVVAKIVTVLIPYLYKMATDALTGELDLDGAIGDLLPVFLLTPVMLVIAYNIGRVVMVGFNQLRDALFASVGQFAVRRLASIVFAHLHALSLRYHLQRRTGGLSRVIERGTKGIESIVRFSILNGLPTVLEFALMAVVIWYWFDFRYVAVIVIMVIAYVWFTIKASDWRIGIRRDMNDNDTDANSKAIDSLLNFETVKYFGNEQLEADRFGASMLRYERAATKVWTSLAWLNFGQAVIMGFGMGVCMILSAVAVRNGTQTLGDFVMINALLMQLFIPLNFIGFIYREIARVSQTLKTCSISCRWTRRSPTRRTRRSLRSARGPLNSETFTSTMIPTGKSSRMYPLKCQREKRLRSSGRRARANPRSRASCSAFMMSPAAAS